MINTILKQNNTTQHYGRTDLGQFYTDTTAIFKTNGKIFDTLVKQQLQQLHYIIKWATEHNTVDNSDTLRNIHSKHIRPREREVAYRLIYNTTPISTNSNANTTINITCQMCRQNIQETEKHNLLECNARQLAKQTLGAILKTKQIDVINKTIILNNITK